MPQTDSTTRTVNADQPSVEMPRPTAWPVVLGLGITLLGLGAATSLMFCAVGALLFVIAIVGWISQLLPGRGHEHEELVAGGVNIAAVARPGTVEQLKPGVVGYRFQLPEKVQPISAGVKGGIVGGLLMPIPALAWGVMSGHGIWFPVNLLAGMVIPGLTDMPKDQLVGSLEAFHPLLFVGAAVLHICMSVGFGLIGGVLLPTLPQIPGGPLLFGGLILPLLWSGVNHSFMHLVNPLLNDYIDWRWYVASQLVFGIAASLVIIRSEKIAIAPRGPGGDEGGPSVPAKWLACLAIACTLLSGCSDNLPGKPTEKDKFVMPSDVKDFATLYSQRCAGCHGARGILGAGPPLNDAMFVALVTDDELHRVIAEGRKGTLMPAWSRTVGGALTEEQIAVLVEGIKQRQWKAADGKSSDSTSEVFPSAPPLISPTTAGPSNAEQGAAIFAAACANCHGIDGKGIVKAGDTLNALNQPAFLGLSSNRILRRYIITGRADLGMPNFAGRTGRSESFQPLTSDQVENVVALLAKWRNDAANQE